MLTDVVGVEPMANKPKHENCGRDAPHARPRRTRKSVWDDAEIVVNIEYTKPGTALDDHLRKEQTRALLDLLADYVQKLDKSGHAAP
jgi:hypothetical protein